MPSTRRPQKAIAFAAAGLAVLGAVAYLATLAENPHELVYAPDAAPPVAASVPDAAPPPDAPSGLAIEGKITAENAPVPNARVVVSRKDGAWRATADAAGVFKVAGLPDDELALDVFAPGFLPPAPRKVRPGAPVEVELQRGAVVSGRALDHAGVPVAGVEIELSVESGSKRITVSAAERAHRQVFAEGTSAAAPRARLLPLGELGVMLGQIPRIPPRPALPVAAPASVVSAAEFVTGADGSFRITGVPRGRFNARARHPDFADAEVGPLEPEATVTFDLLRGAELSGRVTDMAGLPIFGAEVVVREMARTKGVTFSGKDGAFRLAHVTGPLTLRAGARGYATAQRELVAEEGGRVTADFSLAATGEAPPPGADETGGLRLDLRDGQTLGPLLSFTVTARGPRGASLKREGVNGELTLAPLAAGEWTLTVEARGFASQAFNTAVVPGDPAPLRLALTQGATIAGTVYSRHGEPVAGAEVACGLVRGRTSPTGSFRLTGVPIGEVAVRAGHPSEGHAEIVVPLRNGDEALTLELRLE